MIDNTAPTVSSVSASTADGSYANGTTIAITVNFSESVTVDTSGGTPTLALGLDSGGPESASYASGSGSASAIRRSGCGMAVPSVKPPPVAPASMAKSPNRRIVADQSMAHPTFL